MSYININGKITRTENDSRQNAYGLFETLLFRDNEIALKELHFERLFAGIGKFKFNIPPEIDAQWVEAAIKKTVGKNKMNELCRIRVTVSVPANAITKQVNPDWLIACFPIEPQFFDLNETGLSVGIAKGIYKETDSLSNVKSCNRQVYVAASQLAGQHTWDDALILNTGGHIIESTIANVFWIKAGVIYTPPLADGSVAGVMRRHIIQQLANHNITVTEKNLTEQELLKVDEVFLTNAVRRIKWIGNIGNARYGNAQVKQIHSLIF